MLKKSEFHVPRRQSQWAIIFIVLKYIRRLFAQLWPILLAIFIGRGSNQFDRFEMAIAGVGIFGMIASIISYYKYYYHVSEDELIIEKGVLKKTKLNIPFGRIQSINFHQNFLHQLLAVTEVEIETAGSDQSELQIDALTLPTAEALRSTLLQKKALLTNADLAPATDVVEKEESILELTTEDLIKVGLTENHFKPVGLLIGLMGSAIAYSFTLDYDPTDIYEFVKSQGTELTIQQYIVIGLLLIPFAILYSVLTTFLRYYKLKFLRKEDKFQVVQGLLNKKQFAALDKKIQILSWGQNPFERLIGLFNIYFRQARSGAGENGKMTFRIPGCRKEKIEYVKNNWLGRGKGIFQDIYGVSKHYFIRRALYQSAFFGLLCVGSLLFQNVPVAILVLIVWLMSVWLTWLEWEKKKYAFNGDEIYVGGGILGFKHTVLPVYKVQNITIYQNPYQWRRDLASLYIHTAAGHLTIPYISESLAYELLDRFTYHVEISKRPWM